jgi:hypothetical protein
MMTHDNKPNRIMWTVGMLELCCLPMNITTLQFVINIGWWVQGGKTSSTEELIVQQSNGPPIGHIITTTTTCHPGSLMRSFQAGTGCHQPQPSIVLYLLTRIQ